MVSKCFVLPFHVTVTFKSSQILYCPTNALNYMNCRVIKNTLKCKSCSNMFRFTQEPSSGSQSQCLAKITGMVPLCLSICALPVGTHISISTVEPYRPTMLPAVGRQHSGCIIPQAVTHSLVLLKMGKIISRNMLSLLELLISRYCCI
jgi:hypothetical protein